MKYWLVMTVLLVALLVGCYLMFGGGGLSSSGSLQTAPTGGGLNNFKQ